jgi:hypothetical protein
MRVSTNFSSQWHAPFSLAVGATLTQDDFFEGELPAVWQLGIGMVLHTWNLLIEAVVAAFPAPELRGVVLGLMNVDVVDLGPLAAGTSLPTRQLVGNQQQRTRRRASPTSPQLELLRLLMTFARISRRDSEESRLLQLQVEGSL